MNPLLVSLLEQYSVQVQELMDLLEAKRITPAVWRDRMGDLLARYHVAALMVGMGQTAVPTDGIALLAGNIANQFGYLDNFATEVAAAEAFRSAWRARAQMYVNSAGAEFWEGYVYRQAGRFLPLPAVPKDGTSICLSNCRCGLRIVVVDAERGDYDVYWELNPAEHCQTCIERAAQWNPLQIRGGMLMETAVKHLPGQHDQMTHAHGGGRRTETNPGGFMVEPLHQADHVKKDREWKTPDDGVVQMYHQTNANPDSILNKGILAGDNYNVFAQQAPTPPDYSMSRYTVEFDANIKKGDMYAHGGISRYEQINYENPHLNHYRTDFDYYGVWTSGGKDIPPQAIRKIYDNYNNQIVYEQGE